MYVGCTYVHVCMYVCMYVCMLDKHSHTKLTSVSVKTRNTTAIHLTEPPAPPIISSVNIHFRGFHVLIKIIFPPCCRSLQKGIRCLPTNLLPLDISPAPFSCPAVPPHPSPILGLLGREDAVLRRELLHCWHIPVWRAGEGGG